MLDDIEIWETIKEFPRYQVSNMGKIKSLIGKEKILKGYINEKGYLIVKLSKKTNIKGVYEQKALKVHRLVAQYFCENYTTKKEVHHKDLQRNNNKAINLICLTKSEHLEIHKKLREQQKKEKEKNKSQQPEDKGVIK